ncbi:MAG: hypothetical protein GAK31_03316 [Stenotrophomonas maltophilia]|uniref:GYF domain-containing protein n=1 Tax=Stenotrophomonas maltophilia TaxID=40324 RepID=A0A7V8FDE0_STEMA|nr:MAG: hypothetical protein GAK31_03316 [Stenotrophomonas maltophilia]
MQQAQWYYTNDTAHRNGEGPVSEEALAVLRRAGTITPQTLLWCDGMADWRPLAELEHLLVVPAREVDSGGQDPYRAPAMAPEPAAMSAANAPMDGDMALYAAVVGPNFAVYRQRWQLDRTAPGTDVTWHWPGFLFGMVWMMYRKMYRFSAIWLGVMFLITLLEALLSVPPLVSLLITLGLSVVIGTQANRWYLAHCQRQIVLAKGVAAGDPGRMCSELERRGGTSGAGIAIALVVALAVSGLFELLAR